MVELIFATNNQHKVEEINHMLGLHFKIITLQQAGILIEIAEPYNTLEENASEKSRVIFNLTKKPCFAEDTGLEVFALEGRPGVKSARYAGESRSSIENINKVLAELMNEKNRKAQFRTVISLLNRKEHHVFEGVCEGTIIASIRGEQGFGYDPVFVPDGSDKTFAEMNINEKSKFSHRAKAVAKMVAFLKEKDSAI